MRGINKMSVPLPTIEPRCMAISKECGYEPSYVLNPDLSIGKIIVFFFIAIIPILCAFFVFLSVIKIRKFIKNIKNKELAIKLYKLNINLLNISKTLVIIFTIIYLTLSYISSIDIDSYVIRLIVYIIIIFGISVGFDYLSKIVKDYAVKNDITK